MRNKQKLYMSREVSDLLESKDVSIAFVRKLYFDLRDFDILSGSLNEVGGKIYEKIDVTQLLFKG